MIIIYLKACSSINFTNNVILFDTRLAADVAASISQLNSNYDELVQIQGDAATADSQAQTKRCGLYRMRLFVISSHAGLS